MTACMVSVIVPMYNAAAYLPEFFSAMESQTLADYELICVDDGSADDTLQQLRARARQDARVRALTQPNAGAGAARNAGLAAAQGQYVICLDVDDCYTPALLETLCGAAQRAQADIVLCPFARVDCKTGVVSHFVGFEADQLPQGRPFAPWEVSDLCGAVNPGPINKLYRRAFVQKQGLRYSATRVANDVFFGYAALLSAEKLLCLQQELLTVRRYHNPGSISANRFSHLEDSITVFGELFAWAAARGEGPQVMRQLCHAAVQGFQYNTRFGEKAEYWAAVEAMLNAPPWSGMPTGEIAQLFDYPAAANAQAERLRALQREGNQPEEIRQLTSQQAYFAKLGAYLRQRRAQRGEPAAVQPSRGKRLLWKLMPASKQNLFDKTEELLREERLANRRLMEELHSLHGALAAMQKQLDAMQAGASQAAEPGNINNAEGVNPHV